MNLYRGDNWKLLDFNESMKYFTNLEESFNNNTIDYTVFDIETTSLSPWEGEIISFSFYNKMSSEAVCIPLVINNNVHKDWDKPVDVVKFNIDNNQKLKLKNECKRILELVPLVGHNLKFDLKFCKVHLDLDLQKVKIKDDTIIMAFIKWSKTKSLALKYLCRELFEIPEDWEKELWAYIDLYNLNKDKHFGNVPTIILGKYASLDCYYTEMLYEYLKKYKIDGTDNIKNIVTSLIIPFTEVETNGLHCDVNMVDFIHNSLTNSNNRLTSELLSFPEVLKLIEYKMPKLMEENNTKRNKKTKEALMSGAFNIKSTKDLRELFFNPSLFSLPRKDVKISEKTGEFSVDKTTLSKLQTNPDVSENAKLFLNKLLLYKDNSKLITTYTSKIKEECIDDTFKPEYNLIGTVSGRLSSGFHTWPKKADIKRVFDSRWKNKGGLILTADFSQLELRILCSIANEPVMIQAFNEGKDLHTTTASLIFNKSFEYVTKEERNKAKTINFGIAYGMSQKSLMESLGCSEEESYKIYDGFFTSYPDISKWINKQQKQVFKDKGIFTHSGRFIPIVESYAGDDFQKNNEVGAAKRKAINFPIQGSASDVVTCSYLATYKYIKQKGLKSLFIGTVHDSVQYDVYPGELFEIINQVRKNSEKLTLLENPWIKCPLRIDVAIGASWGGCVDLSLHYISQDQMTCSVEGKSKDIKQLYHILNSIYQVEYKVVKEEEIDEASFQHNEFIKDALFWVAEFDIKRQQ